MHDQRSDTLLDDSSEPKQKVSCCPFSGGGSARWPVYLLLLAMIVVPAIFWRQVWWGSPLSDAELSKRLSQPDNARQVQHALEQLSRRIERNPESARPFYPQVIALAGHGEPLVRSAAAWLMGEDNQHEPFRDQLRQLLTDEEPVVRYNAATALTRFGDDTGRPVLREMLAPHVVKVGAVSAALDGTVLDVLRQGDFVRPLTQLALIDLGGEQKKVLAPLEGRLERVTVSKGRHVQPGDEIAAIAPNPNQVEAALRALYLVGHAQDLDVVEPYVEPADNAPARVAQQARATVAAIRQREGSG